MTFKLTNTARQTVALANVTFGTGANRIAGIVKLALGVLATKQLITRV